MTSASSTISICNRSLLSIGARAQISSLQEGSTEANACAQLFIPVFQMLARTANWNCLRAQAVLSLLAAAQGTPENPSGIILPIPPTPWLYSYALPSDCLQVRYLIPTFPNSPGTGSPISPALQSAPTWIPGDGQIPFAVAYSTDSSGNPITIILTNQSQAQAIYTIDQPNPVIWDSIFQQAMVASLASYLVPALSLNISLMDRSVAVAEKIIQQARVRDGDEGVTVMDHLPDWIRARGTGYGVRYGGETYGFYSYSEAVWP